MHGRSKCMLGLYFHPARNDFSFGNKMKSYGARSGEYGGEAKQLLFLFFKNAKAIVEEKQKLGH